MSAWRWSLAERAYRRGYRHLRGEGAPHDPRAAVHWLTQAARRGHERAQHALSMVYLTGVTGHAPSRSWLAEARARSSAAAENAHLLYPEGLDVKPDSALAFAWAKAAARRGLACAQANLGMLLTRGIGCRRDFDEAVLWYRRAAEQGEPAGALGLGILYEAGLGVPKDIAEAMHWYRKAAESGNDVAATALGLLLLNGVEPDLDEAQRWLHGPAARCFAHAQYGMGLLALKQRDEARAKFWLSKAAAQSHPAAQAALKPLGPSGAEEVAAA